MSLQSEAAKAERAVTAYWWSDRLYSEGEAPPLAAPSRVYGVVGAEWACLRCGARAEWDPEPRCPVCGALCRPRPVAREIAEPVEVAEALECAFSRMCRAKLAGAALLGIALLPDFAWESLDIELPDGSRLVGVYAGKVRLRRMEAEPPTGGAARQLRRCRLEERLPQALRFRGGETGEADGAAPTAVL